MRSILTAIVLLVAAWSHAGDITVREGESLHNALRQAREWRRTNDARCQGGITITIEGRHYMNEPLFLRPEDSGTASSPTVLRGGTLYGDPRQKHTQVWPVPSQQSPQAGAAVGQQEVLMERMLDFNPADRTITIPTPPADVLGMKDLEMVVHQRWAIAILRVKAFDVRGSRTVVSFMEPESRLEFEHPWPQPVIVSTAEPGAGATGTDLEQGAGATGTSRGNSAFLLRTTEQRDGIEQLVILDGASHVTFDGVAFEHTCWNRPRHQGHVTLQGGFPLVDAYKLAQPGLPWDPDLENQAWVVRPVSAVTVRNAQAVTFTRCSFRHLAATALDYETINGGTVSNCTFEDIGGTAILAGSFAESPREVHQPYTDLAPQCQGLSIVGNSIHDATNEDWGAVAIALGYVRHCTIEANHVSHVNYSGICLGWGWTPLPTGMEDNHIVRNVVSDYARQLYDAGGIYTLSNQPASSIVGNQISRPYPAPYATNDRGFCIYLDARTDGFSIQGNTTEGRPLRRDEVGDNHPGPAITFDM